MISTARWNFPASSGLNWTVAVCFFLLAGIVAGESAPQRAAQHAAAVAGNRRALRNPEPAGAGDAGDVFSPRERGGQMKSAVKPPPEVV